MIARLLNRSGVQELQTPTQTADPMRFDRSVRRSPRSPGGYQRGRCCKTCNELEKFSVVFVELGSMRSLCRQHHRPMPTVSFAAADNKIDPKG